MSENFIKCPKCGSTQLHADKKGFSAGKAIGGAVLTGGIGLLAGFHGSKKVIITCLSCGNKFRPGENVVQNRVDAISCDERKKQKELEKKQRKMALILLAIAVIIGIIIAFSGEI